MIKLNPSKEIKEDSYHDKVENYINGMELERKLCLDHQYFADGENKYHWYQKENKKLEKEYQQNLSLSENRIEQIADFARIDQYYYNELKIRKMTFLEKASEYKNAVLQLKRHVKVSDNLKFSNGDIMCYWLSTQNYMMEMEQKDKKEVSPERKKEIEILADINHLIEGFHVPKRLSFEQKAKEYHNKLYEIGRAINENDPFRFSDQSKMSTWFLNQLVDYRVNSKKFPYKYKNRFPILLSIYTSIESLSHESYDNYVSKVYK